MIGRPHLHRATSRGCIVSAILALAIVAEGGPREASEAEDIQMLRRVAADVSPLRARVEHNLRLDHVQRLLKAWQRRRPPLLSSLPQDSTAIALWALLICLGDDPDRVIDALPLVDNRTLKLTLVLDETGDRIRVDVSTWVRVLLSYRSGLPFSSEFLQTAASARARWMKLCAHGQPADWAFRFRKAGVMGRDKTPIKKQLQSLPARERGVVVSWIGVSVPEAIPRLEVRKIVAEALGVKGIRHTLGDPGEDLRELLSKVPEGQVRRFRSLLIRSLKDIVTSEDIDWLQALALDKKGRLDWDVFDVIRTAFGQKCRAWLKSRYEGELDRLSRSMDSAPTRLSTAIAMTYGDPVSMLDIQSLLELAEHIGCVDVEFLKKTDARHQGIVAIAAGMSDDLDAAKPIVLLLSRNDAKTIPEAWVIPGVGGMAAREQTVRGALERVLEDRGLDSHGDAATAMRQYAEFIKTPLGQAAEWLYRFRKEDMIGGGVGVLREHLSAIPQPVRGLATVAIAARSPDTYSNVEIAHAVKDIDRKLLWALLTEDSPWDTAPRHLQIRLRVALNETILQRSLSAFSVEDAKWFRMRATDGKLLATDFLIAAARLNPKEGGQWLIDGIQKGSSSQLSRCVLLEALWAVGGESHIPYVKDRYFAEVKPEYNAGGLQENLVERLGKSEGAKAAPLLKALVLDRRFTTLGWAATRAFAQNAVLILGEETKEVKRYLSVKHRMGVYDFEQQPNEREKYLVDTKHVLMQTEAFQIWLQGEVLKRIRKGNGHE